MMRAAATKETMNSLLREAPQKTLVSPSETPSLLRKLNRAKKTEKNVQ